MLRSSIALILLVVSSLLAIKHGWDTFNVKKNPESLKMFNDLEISLNAIPVLGVSMFLIGILLWFPQTYFIANMLNAMSIIFVMSHAVRVSNFKMALMEIPFLILPLVMIWLKYPFYKQ